MSDLLLRFSERKVWGLMQAACDQLRLPYPRSVRRGCVEIIFESMLLEQAQALLTVYHNGQLKNVMNKVGYLLTRVILSAVQDNLTRETYPVTLSTETSH